MPAYAALGQLGPENLWTAAVLLPIAIASTWAGVILIRRVAVDRFYTVIYGLLLLVGARLVYAGLAS